MTYHKHLDVIFPNGWTERQLVTDGTPLKEAPPELLMRSSSALPTDDQAIEAFKQPIHSEREGRPELVQPDLLGTVGPDHAGITLHITHQRTVGDGVFKLELCFEDQTSRHVTVFGSEALETLSTSMGNVAYFRGPDFTAILNVECIRAYVVNVAASRWAVSAVRPANAYPELPEPPPGDLETLAGSAPSEIDETERGTLYQDCNELRASPDGIRRLACELFLAQHSGNQDSQSIKAWWSGLPASHQQEWVRRALQSLYSLEESWTHAITRRSIRERRTAEEQKQILQEHLYQLAVQRACLEHVVNLFDSTELRTELQALDHALDERYDQLDEIPPIDHGAAFLLNTIALPPSGEPVDAWWTRILLNDDNMTDFE